MSKDRNYLVDALHNAHALNKRLRGALAEIAKNPCQETDPKSLAIAKQALEETDK